MPYCVKYYYDSNKIVVENRDYQPIYEGLAPSELDCKSAFHAFACPKPDCYVDNGDIWDEQMAGFGELFKSFNAKLDAVVDLLESKLDNEE